MRWMGEPLLNGTGRRVIDAGTHLLDRQMLDKDGALAGKVDDLELTFLHGGAPGTNRPFVSAILAGPGALGPRLGGAIARVVNGSHAVLHPTTRAELPRISFGVVKKVHAAVELAVSRDELDVVRTENWVRENIISKIPGAHHAPQ
jgi:hypothetical protein